MHLKILFFALIGILLSRPCHAHGFTGSGLLHPLTGLDHMLAMVAVGVWSAQLGGKFIFRVPLAFIGAMLIGAMLGVQHLMLTGIDVGIALSVLLLGLAITLERQNTLLFAALGVGLFGGCHGYAHGYEMPNIESPWSYVIGFLITTAGLHLTGVFGGLLILEEKQGKIWLRLAGAATVISGGYLLLKQVYT